jgi:hypothetical protein
VPCRAELVHPASMAFLSKDGGNLLCVTKLYFCFVSTLYNLGYDCFDRPFGSYGRGGKRLTISGKGRAASHNGPAKYLVGPTTSGSSTTNFGGGPANSSNLKRINSNSKNIEVSGR